MSIVPYEKPSHLFIVRKSGNLLKKELADYRTNVFSISHDPLSIDKLRKTIDSLQQENLELLEKLNDNLSLQKIEHLEHIIENYKIKCPTKGDVHLIACGENIKRNKCSNCRILKDYLQSINVI